MKPESVVKVMDLATVVSDRKLKGSGLSRGDVVVVVGTEMVPATKRDLYLQRVLINVAKFEDHKILEDQIYKIDPRSVEKILDPDVLAELVGEGE